MKIDGIRDGLEALRTSIGAGWDRLRRSARSALTYFRPGDPSELPAPADVDDADWAPGLGWAMLGGDVFEDGQRVVVRIEAPGLEAKDFDLEVLGDTLTVRGEKHFERESGDGRWRVLQCAYGRFQRSVALPARVRAEAARARYRNGVLRVELPKAEPGRSRRIAVAVR